MLYFQVSKTDEKLGVKSGQIIDSSSHSEELLKVLESYNLGNFIKIDEVTYSKLAKYEEKSYPKYFAVTKDNSLLRANCDTSDTFIASEWDIEIKGAE